MREVSLSRLQHEKSLRESTHSDSLFARSSDDLLAAASFRNNFSHLLRNEQFLSGATKSLWEAYLPYMPRRFQLRLSPGPKIEELPREEFERIVQPASPTIGAALTGFFHDHAFLPFAVEQLREDGIAAPNVVFLSPFELDGATVRRYENGECRLFAERGIIVDHNGRWMEGKFPYPLEINLVAHTYDSGNPIAHKLEELQIMTCNPMWASKLLCQKHEAKVFLNELGVSTPTGIFLSTEELRSADVKGVLQKVAAFLDSSESSEFVIKPESYSGGTGVQFMRTRDARKITDGLLAGASYYPGGWLLEERLECFPLKGIFGRKMDWNLRILAHAHGVIDVEARVHSWGNPVNKCKGAKIEELSYIVDQINKNGGPTYEEMRTVVDALSVKIAKALNVGFIGLDLIWDRNNNPWIIEVNAGPVGGLTSLYELRRSDRDRLAAPRQLAAYLGEQLTPRRAANHEEFIETPLFSSPLESSVLTQAFLHDMMSTPFGAENSGPDDLGQRLELTAAAVEFAESQGNRSLAVRLLQWCVCTRELHQIPAEYVWRSATRIYNAHLGAWAKIMLETSVLPDLARSPHALLERTQDEPLRQSLSFWRVNAFKSLGLKQKADVEQEWARPHMSPSSLDLSARTPRPPASVRTQMIAAAITLGGLALVFGGSAHFSSKLQESQAEQRGSDNTTSPIKEPDTTTDLNEIIRRAPELVEFVLEREVRPGEFSYEFYPRSEKQRLESPSSHTLTLNNVPSAEAQNVRAILVKTLGMRIFSAQ